MTKFFQKIVKEKKKMRINKYIANSGFCSRREADRLIDEKRVLLNEKLADKGSIVEKNDVVKIDGRIIKLEINKVYLILNKPIGYTTTLRDKFAERLVLELISDINERIYPIGRLDKNSEGLLLFTNDGEIAYRLTHPNHDVEKEYIVTVDKPVKEIDLKNLSSGVVIDGRITRKARFEYVKDKLEIRVFLKEGRNRQIRKMFKSLGYNVLSLKRLSFGEISLGSLKLGEYRHLTEKEVKYLRSIK